MVGKCSCGKRKFNLHNKSLTEIPWLCDNCKTLRSGFRDIIRNLRIEQPRRIHLTSIKRREYA